MQTTEHPVPGSRYRGDIDGLRTVAVMAVICFHAGFTWMTGGFVGVDVFFVISGYLITQKLSLEFAKNNRISFSRFYSSRIRRLFPALLATVLLSAFFAYFLLGPEALINYSESAIASILSFSNIYFWTQAGYWDTAAHVKPLLHTWSLSVEEQFYLLWPLLILGLAKTFSNKLIVIVLGLISIVSLIAAEIAVKENPSMAFYLTPFRIYEFAIGGVCYFVAWPKRLTMGMFSEFMSIFGLAVIIATSVLYNASTPFPGITALLPCLGAAAIIIARHSKFNRLLLGNRPMIVCGLISYSLYLAHWPIFVFYKMYKGSELVLVEQIGLIIATFVVAYMLYNFIEKPLRRPKIGSNKLPASAAKVGLIAVTSALVLTLFATFTISNSGFPNRYSSELTKLAILKKTDIQLKRERRINTLCKTNWLTCGAVNKNKRNILIVGDSHGTDGLNIVEKIDPNANFLVSATGGCPPFRSLKRIQFADKKCSELNQTRFEWFDSFSIKPEIILSVRLSNLRVPATVQFVEEWVEKGFKVSVLGVGPHYREEALEIALSHGTVYGLDKALTMRSHPTISGVEQKLEPLIVEAGGIYISKLSFLCPDGICTALTRSGDIFIYDKNHMTLEGAVELGRQMKSNSILTLN